MSAIATLPIEQLRAYIRDLAPETRDLLLAEFERAALRGQDGPGASFVLQELRNEIRGINVKVERVGNPQRLFFQPLEPFLVSHAVDAEHEAQIPRACLDPFWQWLVRDVMPSETEAFADEISRALLASDKAATERCVRSFQDVAVVRIEEALVEAEESDRTRRRLLAQLGAAKGLKNVQQVADVLKYRDVLALLAARLPNYIKDFSEPQLSSVKKTIDQTVPDTRIAVYALLLLMRRLAHPWQLIRLAVKAAESDAMQRILQTSYGVAFAILVGEIERKVDELRTDLRRGLVTGLGTLLKEIHDGIRILRSEVDLPASSSWGRHLAALRADVSNIITTEIDSLSGRVRRLLRPRPSSDTIASPLDHSEVIEVQALLGFLKVCRQYAGELAVNEITLRIHSELRRYLDGRIPQLLDSLRVAGRTDQKFLRSQIDAAARFAGKIFNSEYASLVAKAAEVASQAPPPAAARG